MRPRFDDPLFFVPDARRPSDSPRAVLACGPIDWQDDEVSAIFDVSIFQQGVIASGVASERVFKGEDLMWMVTAQVRVPRQGALRAGQASALGHAVVRKDDGRDVHVVWPIPPNDPSPQPLELRHIP